MQIVCPHCTTSYAVDPATFGTSGRTVRCARCKETWLATPEEAAATYAMAPGSDDGADAGWDEPPDERAEAEVPVVASPSISSALPDGDDHPAEDAEWTALARQDDDFADESGSRTLFDRLGLSALSLGPLARAGVAIRLPPGVKARLPAKSPINLPTACGIMAALSMALIFWRADVVRLMPQTGPFFTMIGMGVNLRGLAFADVRISTEVVDNKPVLIIEGDVVHVAKKPIEVPRLRFLVRDAHGTEIYAWNAVLENSALKPGEKAWFKSRLASPPAEGREIAVRFFNRRDLAAGGA
jgi:predicted Zn finger-like uncharacterized protein